MPPLPFQFCRRSRWGGISSAFAGDGHARGGRRKEQCGYGGFRLLSADEPGDRLRQKLDVFDFAGLADESGEAKNNSTLAKPEAKREPASLNYFRVQLRRSIGRVRRS